MIKRMICKIKGHNYNANKRMWEFMLTHDDKKLTACKLYCVRCKNFEKVSE